MTAKPKLLYIITQGEWGGAQRYVYDLTTHLVKIFDVTVAIGEPRGAHDLDKKLQEKGIDVIHLNHLVRSITPWDDFLAILELNHLYTVLKPDIIHLNSSKAGIIGSIAGWFNHKPKIVYTAHGWVFDEPLGTFRKGFYIWLERITAGRKNNIITLSQRDSETAERELGLKSGRLAQIPLGITPPSFLSKAEAQRRLSKIVGQTFDSRPLIGTLANYYPTKALDVLIGAAKQTDAYFFLIGEGEDRQKLEHLVAQHQLTDRVFLTGYIPNAAQLLPAFDLFALPSRKEGFPYVLLEAMSASLPIVATDVGGVVEMLVEYPAKIVVPSDDASALSEAIAASLTKKPEKKFPAFRFTLEAMLQTTTSFYQSLLQKP